MPEQKFEGEDFRQEQFWKTIRDGNPEVTPEDFVVYHLLAGMLPGADSWPTPSGTVASEWERPGELQEQGLSSSQRSSMYRLARQLVREEPLAQNVLRHFIIHICGQGPDVSLVSGKEHPGYSRLQKLFPARGGKSFATRARQIIAQTLTNGELYAIHFGDQHNLLEESTLGGRPRLRLCLPDRCTKIKLGDSWSLTPTVTWYEFGVLRKIVKKGRLLPESVTMFTVHEEMNDGFRGMSLFYTLLKELPKYTDGLKWRLWSMRSAATMPIIRYLKGARTPGIKRERPDRPLVIDENEAVAKWEALQAPASAREAQIDMQEFRFRMSQCVSLPEHDVTGNAQYAAQWGQYALPVKLYKNYQSRFTEPLQEMVGKTIGAKPSDVLIIWPDVDVRGRSSIVQEVTQMRGLRIISEITAQRKLGYDPEFEERELKRELERDQMMQPQIPGVASPLAGLLPSTAPAPAPLPAGEGTEIAIGEEGAAVEGIIKTAVPPEGIVALIRANKIVSPYGFTASNLVDTPPAVVERALGIDYGFAAGGAIMVGGLTETGSFVVAGEISLRRVPTRGEASYVETVENLRKDWPFTQVYSGSDEPSLEAALEEKEIDTQHIHRGIDDFKDALTAFRKGGHKVYIWSGCKKLISQLFPDAADVIAGMHTKVRREDHEFDGARYLFHGLLDRKREG